MEKYAVKKFEYEYENWDWIGIGALNKRGSCGWELVSIVRWEDGRYTVIFKREIIE